MASTRRPQINHRNCDHAPTPKARKACRKARRAAEATCMDLGSFEQRKNWVTPEPEEKPNTFKTATLSHELAYLADGTPVPACSKRVTKGEAQYDAHLGRVGVSCNRCSGAHR